MNTLRAACFGLIALAAALPGRARGQACADATPIHCGDSLVDNSGGGSNGLEDYSCETWSFVGRDFVYALELPQAAQVHVNLQPDWGLFTAWDAGLMVLPQIDGDCYSAATSYCVDDSGSGGDEDLTAVLPAGTHYLVVDGYRSGDYGDFEIQVECTPCDECQDADGDGYSPYAASGCPCGTDCADDDPAINPAALEICGDGIDQDCDGQDPACPNCAANSVLACSDTGNADTGDGGSNLNHYCGSDESYWDTREYILAMESDGDATYDVQIANFGSLQLDAFAFRDYGVSGVCNKDDCLDRSTRSSGDEHLVFFARAGQTYFVSVDGRDGDQGSFDYTFSCLNESCEPQGPMSCGSQIDGDTGAGSNLISAYAGLDHHLLGPESAYTFSNPSDAWVTLVAQVDVPGLDLMVIEDDGGGQCLPANLIAASALTQTADSSPPEVLQFMATGGASYYVVVDGRETGDAGGFHLRADCLVECPPELTECSGACVDLTGDPAHCGSCTNACELPHAVPACADATCQVGECEPLWGDCNQDSQDGCESDFNTDQNCGACGRSCLFDHAQGWCEEGHCVMGECDPGWDNCNDLTQDGCEAYLLSAQHCGNCDNSCTAEQVCHQGECLDDCPADLSDCEGACVDTDSDLQHCGGCNAACTVANGSPLCSGGVCQIASCHPTFEDCNQDPSDGCEIQLGTLQNCSTCGDRCEYANAGGICDAAVCVMGACDPGYGNYDTLTSNGCEAALESDHDNCGTCGRVCGVQEICDAGVCTLDCDVDDDGHESQACSGDDCDDLDGEVHPGAEETCGDGIDQDCDGQDLECTCFDNDGDGYTDGTCGGDDCDDDNGFIYPGAQEKCGDGIDQDCDGEDLPCTCPDSDNDGHNSSACGGDDCDDADHGIYPGARETCGDGIDQDCDGEDPACDDGCGCSQQAPSGSLSLLLPLGLLLLIVGRPKESQT